jgi:hypothetical protein
MALWKIEPTFKKSLLERCYYFKDGKTMMIETGWRWGEFTCETVDDNPPTIVAGDDLYSCGYDVELQECTDGCWEEHEFIGFTEEEEEAMIEWLDENSWLDLEEEGWSQGDTEMIIDCDPAFEMISETDDAEDVKTGETVAPKKEWPF